MTYEQASARGLRMRRSDDRVFHFRDTVRQQFVSSISTLETAARERQKLLESFYRYRQSAIEEGNKESLREYILVRRGDTSAVDKLAAGWPNTASRSNARWPPSATAIASSPPAATSFRWRSPPSA
jgi:hypothetical protein